jgi:hypothetical protein
MPIFDWSHRMSVHAAIGGHQPIVAKLLADRLSINRSALRPILASLQVSGEVEDIGTGSQPLYVLSGFSELPDADSVLSRFAGD